MDADTTHAGDSAWFRSLQWRAPELTCPRCGTCAISVHPRCDLRDRECLPVAICGQCNGEFDPYDLRTFGQETEAVRKEVAATPCRVCGANGLTLRSLCDRHAHNCFFLAACGACGDVHVVG